MKVLFVSVEIAPFAKTGGMSDVCRYLPKALKKKDLEIRLITPKFKSLSNQALEKIGSYNIAPDKNNELYRYNLYYTWYEQIQTYFVENKYYFCRDKIYGYSDEAERFFYFSYAVVDAMSQVGYFPDIVHINDWHASIIPLILKKHKNYNAFYKNTRTILTIHNMAYKGIFGKEDITRIFTRFNSQDLLKECVFSNQQTFSFLGTGLIHSDVINTVSTTYAKEITPEVQYLSERTDVYGILNGIEIDEYNPDTDKWVWRNYSKDKTHIKSQNKLLLQKFLKLKQSKQTPLVTIISRLVIEKGLELLLVIIDKIVSYGIQCIMMGDGDERIMNELVNKVKEHPDFLYYCPYEETLARKLYAGSDIFLMPSFYEPCGTTQIIAQRYGTIPIVHETGGLCDTVKGYDRFGSEATGFSFKDNNSDALINTILHALQIMKQKNIWQKLVVNAMNYNYSWEKASEEYIMLYKMIVPPKS